jgi:hypothetical protein
MDNRSPAAERVWLRCRRWWPLIGGNVGILGIRVGGLLRLHRGVDLGMVREYPYERQASLCLGRAARTRRRIIAALPSLSAGARPRRRRTGPVTSGKDRFATGPACPASLAARMTLRITGS